jgi:hypothetical protein
MTLSELNRRSIKKLRYLLPYYAAIVGLVVYYSILDFKAQQSPFHTASWNFSNLNLLAVAIFGFVGDLPVLHYHASHPVHAKFKLNPWRRFVLAVHVISGLTEILAQFAAFFSPPPETVYWSYLACAAAVLGHIPTAILQAPNVFGIKSFTIPFYAIFIAMHIYATINLFQHPASAEAILKQFVALHGYAWVRIAIWWFFLTNTMQAHSYTAAIWFAGFLTCPPVLGEAANFFFVVALAGFQLLLALSNYLPPRFLHTLLGFGPAGVHPMTNIEFSRDGLGVLPQSLIRAAVEMELTLEKYGSLEPEDDTGLLVRQKKEQRRASVMMTIDLAALDTSPTSLSLVASPDVEGRTRRRTSYLDNDPSPSKTYTPILDEARLEALDNNSLEAIELMDEVCGRAHELTREDRARIVYHMFAGADGEINLRVLAAVLVYWTVPISDVQLIMDKYGTADGCIDLETWTAHLDDIYEYVIHLLCVFKGMAYHHSRIQNLGTDKCPVHAIKDALSVPNAILLEEQ